MSPSKLDDLYERLTSRKFLLCLVSLGIFTLGYANGSLTYEDFSKAVLGAVLTYSAAEAATDAAAAWHTSPDTTVRTTVNTTAAPEAVTEPPVAATRPKRVRKPKVKPVEVAGRG